MLDGGTHDPLQPLDEQHGQISEWASQMRASAAFAHGLLTPGRVERLARFYRSKVLNHFRYEERVLFPALLEICGSPTLEERFAAFISDHDELRLRIEILLGDLGCLTSPGADEALERSIVRRAQLTIDRLLEHAAAEDALLMPLMERHGAAVPAVIARQAEG